MPGYFSITDMRASRLLTFVSILLISVCASGQIRTDAYSKLYDSENISSFRKHIGYLSSAMLEGRKAGTDGEAEAARYLYEQLQSYGVEMLTSEEGDIFGIKKSSSDTLTSRNIYGFIQGYDKELKDRYIVIGARMDNLGTDNIVIDGHKSQRIYYGANGNASGMSMMLELAKMVSTNSIMFRRSVIFVGFGASCEGYAGSWYFLNRAFGDSDKIDAMINLDMVGTGYNGFYAYTASNRDLNTLYTDVSEELQPIVPELTAQEPYPSDHRSFYAAEIPSIYFTTGKYPQYSTSRDDESIIDYESMERELEYIYNFTLALSNLSSAPSFRGVQVEKIEETDDITSYHECDVKPMFQNSPDIRQFMTLWVYQYLKYPQYALEKGIQGTVQVTFIVEKDGKVTNATITRGVHESLDSEALKVVSASPKWRAGRVNGEKVRTYVSIPIEFKLEKRSGRNSFGINGREIKNR